MFLVKVASQLCRLRVKCMIQGMMLSEMRPKQLRSNNDMSKNESGISSFFHDAVLCTVGSVTFVVFVIEKYINIVECQP